MTALYRVEGLTKVYGGRTVLSIPSLAIARHQIYALIGANGAGKSTLLQLMAFLSRPTAGKLQFCGEEVRRGSRDLVRLRRRVVLVDQYPVHFSGTVAANVAFGLRVRGVGKGQCKRRVAEVLRRVGMEDFALADAQKLSGGEGKRVALARALVIEPEVLLCDEPTANVDEENQEIILEVLATINRVQRTSIVMATHSLSQSRRLATQTLLLEHGTLSGKSIRREDVYRCRIKRGDDRFWGWRLSGGLSLLRDGPLRSGLPDLGRGSLDQEGMKDLGLGPEIQQNRITGRILAISQDQAGVLLRVECGVSLLVLLEMEEYQGMRPGVGDQVRLHVARGGLRFTPRKALPQDP